MCVAPLELALTWSRNVFARCRPSVYAFTDWFTCASTSAAKSFCASASRWYSSAAALGPSCPFAYATSKSLVNLRYILGALSNLSWNGVSSSRPSRACTLDLTRSSNVDGLLPPALSSTKKRGPWTNYYCASVKIPCGSAWSLCVSL